MAITKEELEELYIKQNLSKKKVCSILNIGRGSFNRLSKKYNIKKDWNKVVECSKITNTEKYGVDNPAKSQEIKEKTRLSNLRKYGSHPTQTDVVKKKFSQLYKTGIPQQKCTDTKRLNNSWNKSEDEEQAYSLLVEKFGSDNIERQYKSELYPYPCDFYIKSLDLYIEYQGSWVHGNTPFSENNEIHQKLISKWKEKGTDYYMYAIKVFTYYDPFKRSIAKNNNLNWKEFFNLEELQEWLLQKKN